MVLPNTGYLYVLFLRYKNLVVKLYRSKWYTDEECWLCIDQSSSI